MAHPVVRSPFLARITAVKELHGRGSDRSCVHVEVDVSGSDIAYEAGVGRAGLLLPLPREDTLGVLRFSPIEPFTHSLGVWPSR